MKRSGWCVPVLLFAAACASQPAPRDDARAPRAIVDELLAADRAAGAPAPDRNLIGSLEPIFDDSVQLPVPGNRFAEGKAAALEALRGNADYARARATWAPVRGGVSADGQHGFTFGFMSLRHADGNATPAKYLAYWVRRATGWRVVAYRLRTAPAAPPAGATAQLPPALPERAVPVVTDAATLAAHAASLTAAEAAFSRDAQSIGLDAAFARHGSADAMNLGGSDQAGFVIGADAIGRAVGAGTPTNASPVAWSADRVIVASSGDLGVTFGFIRQNAPAPGARPFPFFTIWRRANTREPWRYIAE